MSLFFITYYVACSHVAPRQDFLTIVHSFLIKYWLYDAYGCREKKKLYVVCAMDHTWFFQSDSCEINICWKGATAKCNGEAWVYASGPSSCDHLKYGQTKSDPRLLCSLPAIKYKLQSPVVYIRPAFFSQEDVGHWLFIYVYLFIIT